MMSLVEIDALKERLHRALEARSDLIDSDHAAAIRLFNGFYEGYPELVVDLYARTLVFFSYAGLPETAGMVLDPIQDDLLERLPWVDCVIRKARSAGEPRLRRGRVTYGGPPAQKVRELGIWYAIDLLMNQDASFYLDTRFLRQWLLEEADGWSVVNLFAYTGSLGAAALAGGARGVVQVDRSRKFLDLARRTVALNHLDMNKMEIQAANFFGAVAYFKRSGELFDCAIVDPPFFSTTEQGTVNLVSESRRVINKVRPIVNNGGFLVAINNALFLSGREYLEALEQLCADGYLSLEAMIPVPPELTGYPNTIVTNPPRDPSPFNHPTKIAILQIRRRK